MFFVIDFETSSLEPWNGQPLTLGIVGVNEDGNTDPEWEYYTTFPIGLMPRWDEPDKLTSTQKWWLTQREENPKAFQAAWGERGIYAPTNLTVIEIANFLQDVEPDPKKRFLCANPAAFDVMWMNFVFRDWEEKPYHYRNLCLRSMRYGIEYGFNKEYGNSRDENDVNLMAGYIEHHALWDARNEARDLQLLTYRSIELKQAQHFAEHYGYQPVNNEVLLETRGYLTEPILEDLRGHVTDYH